MKIFEQKRMSKKWGGLKHTYQQSLIYLTFWNFTMLTITAYNTTIKPYFWNYDIYLEIWHLALFMIFFVIFVMLLEHKYSLPSLYNYTWDMGYKNSTLLKSDIKKILEEIEKLKKEIKND